MISHDQVQAAISAQIDGEPGGISEDVVEAHLEACSECWAYRDKVMSLSRNLQGLQPVDAPLNPSPDLSAAIVAGVETEWWRQSAAARSRLVWGRLVVAAMAIFYALWAVILVASSGSAADPLLYQENTHVLLEVAGMKFALALGIAMCAWLPRLIPGFVVVPATLATFSLGVTVRDVLLGIANSGQLLGMSGELLTLAALFVTWAADAGVGIRSLFRKLGAGPASTG